MSIKEIKELICLGCFSCHHVMSVCMPVKMCFRERQFTYLVLECCVESNQLHLIHLVYC